MAINSILQFSVGNSSSADDDGGQNFIGVLAPAGKTLAPDEILRRAVMSALETSDAAQADEFIKQNNLSAPREMPVFRQDGQVIYQLPVDEKFFPPLTISNKKRRRIKRRLPRRSVQTTRKFKREIFKPIKCAAG